MRCRVVGSSALPHYLFNCLLPHTAFPADSIEHSADLVEPVIQVRVIVGPPTTDRHLHNGRLSNLWLTFSPLVL